MVSLSQAGWGIWIARALVAWGGSAAVAFLVSDYVVGARTASLDTAISSINTTLGTGLDSVNTTLAGIQSTGLDTNRKVDTLAEKLEGLSISTTLNADRISRLQADLKVTQTSISNTGREIKSAFIDSKDIYGSAIADAFVKSLVVDNELIDANFYNGVFDLTNRPIFLSLPKQ